MSAKEVAISDIKKELKKTHSFFIPFRKNLNPVMDRLVDEQINAQMNKTFCVSCWTIKDEKKNS